MKNNDTEERRHIFEEHDRSNPEGDYTVKKNKTADWIARVVCVIFAVLIWIYAVSSSNTTYTQVFDAIPVTIEGSIDGYKIEPSDVQITAAVTLIGRRSDVKKVDSDDIRAFIDISSYAPNPANLDESGRTVHKFDISVTVGSKAVAAFEVSPGSVSLTLEKIGG